MAENSENEVTLAEAEAIEIVTTEDEIVLTEVWIEYPDKNQLVKKTIASPWRVIKK